MNGYELLQKLISMRRVLNELIAAGQAATQTKLHSNLPKELEHDFKVLDEAFKDFQMHKKNNNV